MTNKKALLHRTLSLTLLAFIVLISACKTTTDPDPEPPDEPRPIEHVGDKELNLIVINRDTEAELTGYDVEIDGPVSVSENNVSTSQFTLSDLVSGEYTITVSMNGFVAEEITEEFEVPEEVSADFITEITISLRATTPPVRINNSQANTIQTGKADEEDAGEDEEVTLEIPADTFPANVLNEDGTVDVSVTRARPTQVRRTAQGLVRETIALGPLAEINNTINITIPIREIEGLEDLEYVLQPGNIPLTRAENGNLVATISPDVSSHEGYGPTANFWAPIPLDPETWPTPERNNPSRIMPAPSENLLLNETHSTTEFRTIQGRCGEALPLYRLERVDIPNQVRSFLGTDLIKRLESNRDVQVSDLAAIPNRRLSVEVRHNITTYSLSRGGALVAGSTVTANRSTTFANTPIESPCHGQ